MAAPVLDLATFYREPGFRPGDSLVFTVEDWNAGHFRLEHEAAARTAEQATALERWRAAFDDALGTVFETGSGEPEVLGLLASALLELSPADRLCAGVDLTEHLANHPRFVIEPGDSVESGSSMALLAERGQAPTPAAAVEAFEPPAPHGADESLAAIFEDVGFPGVEIVLEALLRQELAGGATAPDGAYQRLGSALPLRFASSAQHAAFQRLAGKRWRELRAGRRAGPMPEVEALRRQLLAQWFAIAPQIARIVADAAACQRLPPRHLRQARFMAAALTGMLAQANDPAVLHDAAARAELLATPGMPEDTLAVVRERLAGALAESPQA